MTYMETVHERQGEREKTPWVVLLVTIDTRATYRIIRHAHGQFPGTTRIVSETRKI